MDAYKARTALVMEGGAMRGMFTCGVIDVFQEAGIEFDAAAGISAGAVFGCNYQSRQIGRAIRYNKRFCRDPRYCSIRSLIKTGDLYGADFCYKQIPDVLDPFDRKAFRENPMKFYVGTTDALTGRPVYHLCTDGEENDILWMRASASMPVFSRAVEVDGYKLLDGGVADAVPYRFMEDEGYRRNVIILTQPAGYRKDKEPAFMNALYRVTLRKYPKIIEALETRGEMYNRQMDEIDEREKTGESIVIRPPEPLNIGRTEKNADELERVYQIGRSEGAARLDEVRSFLSAEDAK